MQKNIYSLIFTLLIIVLGKTTFAQSCGWTNVGVGAASTATYTTYNDMALSSTDVPYISYCNSGATNALTVKTYSAGTWNNVGSLGSFINASHTSIALNGNTPYVAFVDGTNSNRLTVKTYSASTWNNVGTTLTTGTASFVSMAMNGSVPYVAYADGATGNRATVKTYSAGAWSILGAAVSTGSASSISMSIDNSGTPYIIYVDVANSSLATVKKYNGTAWVAVGTGTVSAGAVAETRIDVSYNNVPYIAYFAGGSWQASIKTFTAGSWQAVGTGTVGNVYSHLALTVDQLGTPYISYYDLGPYNCSVSKYDGTSWAYIGAATGIANGTPNDNALAVNSSGAVYAAYGDGSFGAFVKKLGSTTSITNPNPIMLCSGTSGMMNTVVTNTVAGMTYQWQVNPGSGFTNVVNGANYSGATTASLSLNTVPLGFSGYQYRCVVNDLCTHIISGPASLTVNATPTVAVNSSTICQGSSAMLTATGATTYNWSTGATTSVINVSPAFNTTYTVTGTSSAGCASTKTVMVNVNISPIAGMNSNSPVCVGSTISFVNTSTSGGGTIVNYAWSGPNGFVSSVQNPSIPNATSAMSGTYSQTVTNSNGCTGSAMVNVVVNPLPTVITAATSQTICAGNTTTLTASGATTYSWNTAQTTTNISVSPATTTGYTVTGTNSNGCTKTASITITVNPTPSAGAANNSPVCAGDNIFFTDTSTISSGSIVSYTWNGPLGFTSTLQNPSINNSTTAMSGVYSFTAMTATGCVGSASISVLVNPSPVITINASPATICLGNTSTLTASGATTYLWNTSQTTSNIVVSPSTSTSYSVTGTNGSCAKTETITIGVNPLPIISISPASPTLCVTDTIILSASGGVAYNWSTSQTTANISVFPTTSTSYSVTGTNAFGCSNTNATTVTVIASKTFSGNVTSTAGPVSGNMILYKYTPTLSQWDSVTFVPFSSVYNFGVIDKGSYVIKAVPTATNMQATYGSSSISWQGADVITHGCLSNSTPSVNVIALSQFTTTGSGSLSGTITEGIGFGQKLAGPLAPGNPIGGVIVKGGKNPGGSMFVQTITNAAGEYTLSALPNNAAGESYFILVDIAGLDTNGTYYEVVSTGNNQFTGLNFIVDSMKINPTSAVSVHDLNAIEYQIQVYPNPANSSVNINYNLQSSALVKIELFDILGKSVKTILEPTMQSSNKHHHNIKIDDLNSGMYFIKLSINDRESVIKLFVTD